MKDSVLEGLKEEDLIKEYEDEKSFNKKPFLLLLAIALSLLMASYVFISYPSFGILMSLLSSETVSDNTLNFRDYTVIFENNSLEKIQEVYLNEQRFETALCLKGRIENNFYIVDDAYIPRLISQSYAHVSHESCDVETIISLHTHPFRRCMASSQDYVSLRNQQIQNPERAMLIMCEKNRFSFHK